MATPATSIASPITNSPAPAAAAVADGPATRPHAGCELGVLGIESALDLIEHALLMLGVGIRPSRRVTGREPFPDETYWLPACPGATTQMIRGESARTT